MCRRAYSWTILESGLKNTLSSFLLPSWQMMTYRSSLIIAWQKKHEDTELSRANEHLHIPWKILRECSTWMGTPQLNMKPGKQGLQQILQLKFIGPKTYTMVKLWWKLWWQKRPVITYQECQYALLTKYVNIMISGEGGLIKNKEEFLALLETLTSSMSFLV